jgi:hypothetical protein
MGSGVPVEQELRGSAVLPTTRAVLGASTDSLYNDYLHIFDCFYLYNISPLTEWIFTLY